MAAPRQNASPPSLSHGCISPEREPWPPRFVHPLREVSPPSRRTGVTTILLCQRWRGHGRLLGHRRHGRPFFLLRRRRRWPGGARKGVKKRQQEQRQNYGKALTGPWRCSPSASSEARSPKASQPGAQACGFQEWMREQQREEGQQPDRENAIFWSKMKVGKGMVGGEWKEENFCTNRSRSKRIF